MNDNFIKLIHKREATISIGPSTARGMGPKGTINAAQEFLRRIDFEQLSNIDTKVTFAIALDNLTKDFKGSLPVGGQHWGSARKFLNIFLRGALYNRYLCEQYDLLRFEPWLEVPLDSHVATGLHLEKGSDALPRWRTVIGLLSEENQAYQNFAEEIAQANDTYRVHLDLLYWRRSHVAN